MCPMCIAFHPLINQEERYLRLSMVPVSHDSEPLEAFPVDYRRATLVILALGNPHLLEGRERGQDGTADPDAVRGGEESEVRVKK